MDRTDRFEKFFTTLVGKVRALKDSGTPVPQIASQAGLAAPTIYKLLSSERGSRPELRTALLLAASLGVPMSEILADLLPEHAVKVLALHERFPQLIDILYEVLDADMSGPEAEKLMADLRYMQSRKPT